MHAFIIVNASTRSAVIGFDTHAEAVNYLEMFPYNDYFIISL